MNIKPLGDRVVVKKQEETMNQTASGIYIPDSAKEKPQQGKIVAVGSGKKLDNGSVSSMEVKVGDTVLFGQYAGNTVKHNEEEYLIMNESEIFGIIS